MLQHFKFLYKNGIYHNMQLKEIEQTNKAF